MAVPNYQFVVDGSRQRYGNWLFGYWTDLANGPTAIQASLTPAPGGTVLLSPLRVRDNVRLSNQPAIAFYQLRADGKVRERLKASTTDVGDWIDQPQYANLFEVRLVHLNGDPFVGPVGVWQPLDSNREWGVTRSTV